MFDFDNIIRVATAAVGAIVLSTLTIVAAAGPARAADAGPAAVALAPIGAQADG